MQTTNNTAFIYDDERQIEINLPFEEVLTIDDFGLFADEEGEAPFNYLCTVKAKLSNLPILSMLRVAFN